MIIRRTATGAGGSGRGEEAVNGAVDRHALAHTVGRLAGYLPITTSETAKSMVFRRLCPLRCD